MAKIHGAVVVNTERCKGCRLCSWSRSSEYGTMQGMPPVCCGLSLQCAEPQRERGE